MARTLNLSKLIPHMIYIIVLTYFINRMPKKLITVKKIMRYHHDLKHILLWNEIPGFNNEEGQDLFLKKKCPIKNCYVSRNRSLFGDVRYFDAVLFNVKEVSEGSMELPTVRNGFQKYIFVANESADTFPVCDHVYDDFFNWTWTYKLSSTMPFRFFTVKNLHDQDLGAGAGFRHTKVIELDKLSQSQFHSKSKAAVIFLDKCESRSKREYFIRDLQKHLAKYKLGVDVFGNCATTQCRRRSMAPCFWKLRKNYFFYLALEDSFAEDYITEQILYGYQYNAVPIVYGGAHYPDFLPKNSYINAREMNVGHLAKTMNDIIQNRSRYYGYFEWKNHYVFTDYPVLDPCRLCRTLNYKPWLSLKVSYVTFRAWWNSDYKERCQLDWRTGWF